MERVGIRALQQHASDVVRLAAAGEVVEVTDRGRSVARLVPLAASALDDLVTAGLARPARRQASELAAPLAPRRGQPPLSELLRQARVDER